MSVNIEQSTTDEALVRQSLLDKEAFAYLIDRYETRLHRYIARFGRFTKEDIDDVLQNTFIKVYENLHGFDTTLLFSSWIYRIAHNEAMTFFRRRSIRPEGHVATLSEEELYNIASDLDVLRDVERKEMKQLLTRALEILPEKYREVLFLQYFEDKSYDEISDILRIPLGTVGVRLNRAKSKLVDILQTQGYTYDN